MPLFDDYDDETTQITPQEHQRRVEQWELAQKKYDTLTTDRSGGSSNAKKQLVAEASPSGVRKQKGTLYHCFVALVFGINRCIAALLLFLASSTSQSCCLASRS
jgi:hypothetical protein